MDLEYALPTGDELSTRTNYANQAVWDAAATAQLGELTRVYEVDPALSTTISLPGNFRELKIHPKQYNGSTWVEYPEIDPIERYNKSSADKYCYILGNPASGYTATFNNLTANATLSFTYQAYPSGMATLTDKCELSDPTYVVAKVESYVLQARGDDRLAFVDSIADRKLRNMIGRDQKSPGGQYRVAPSNVVNPLA